MKAGCTQAQSLELGSTRSLMQHAGCNLLNWQPRTTGITPQSKSPMLLCQVLAAFYQPTSLEGPLTGEMHWVMLFLSNCLSLCTSKGSFPCYLSIIYPNCTIYLELHRTGHPCFLQKHFKFSQWKMFNIISSPYYRAHLDWALEPLWIFSWVSREKNGCTKSEIKAQHIVI